MGHSPVVTGVSPKDGPPGTRVTIRGEFLGNNATDLAGLKICGCDCTLSAEWKSKNKIIARSGPCKGRGDIIVTTKSGGEGTSTVQFRGYHESIGPVKDSAMWVEESFPSALTWGRRPLSPTSYTPPDPLGLSTEGDDFKFPEDDLNELFPDSSGKLSDENFHPGWYLLEHHNMTTYEDLRAGSLFLERKVDGQKEGQLSFLKANTGSVMEQLDRLVLVRDMFQEDHKNNGKKPLMSLQTAIEDSITSADTLFLDILARKEKADRTRLALAMLVRHKFLFQLPAAIDRNMKKKEYDLVVNDYARVKNLFGWTEVKLFQKVLAEVDKRIFKLRDQLYARIQTMPINLQEQRKFIRLLLSLNWEEDAGWVAINCRKNYIMDVMKKLKEHFKQKEYADGDKSKRRTLDVAELMSGREMCCAALSGVLAEEVPALWTLGRWYFANDLGGTPTAPNRQEEFKAMIIAAVDLYAEIVREALLTDAGTLGDAALLSWLANNLKKLREAYDALIKLDLPSQPLDIVKRVIQDVKVQGMVAFLQEGMRRIKKLEAKETWEVELFSEYGAITKLPRLFESYVRETLDNIKKCVVSAGRREASLLDPALSALGLLHRHVEDMMLAFVRCLENLALKHTDQEFGVSSLSVALGNPKLDSGTSKAYSSLPTWQGRLLITTANIQFTRAHSIQNILNTFEQHGFPKPIVPIQAAKTALVNLESMIADTYLEHKGDPLVGTIEPSMYMGRYKWDAACVGDDARPYVYEIVNNLIAVHAEINTVCAERSDNRFLGLICETVCEELARLTACAAASWTRAAVFQARLEIHMVQVAINSLLTKKARNYLTEALAGIPPLQKEEDIRLATKILEDFKSRMDLQLTSLNANFQLASLNDSGLINKRI